MSNGEKTAKFRLNCSAQVNDRQSTPVKWPECETTNHSVTNCAANHHNIINYTANNHYYIIFNNNYNIVIINNTNKSWGKLWFLNVFFFWIKLFKLCVWYIKTALLRGYSTTHLNILLCYERQSFYWLIYIINWKLQFHKI